MSRDQNDKHNNRNDREDRDEERGPAKGPSYIAFHVRQGEDNKGYFNRIGAAFPHKDGEGHDIVLDATPVDGRVTLRTPQERSQDPRNGGNADQRRGNQNRGPSRDYER
ncbi:MAG: hypothetical protein AAGC70_19205 [Pseudomonadota bacterium]